jgi:hypothetical protein
MTPRITTLRRLNQIAPRASTGRAEGRRTPGHLLPKGMSVETHKRAGTGPISDNPLAASTRLTEVAK